MKIKVKADRKYKYDKDELQNFLHIKRKGSYVGKDKTKYRRKQKHTKAYYND